MALPTWKCIRCEKEFRAGNWECAGGGTHVVASKRYYMNDAPTVVSIIDGRATVNKRDSATLVMNIPPETRTTGPDGNERIIPGGCVQFIRGIAETTNPQEQYWLDMHKGMCNEAEWQAGYLNEHEKLALDKMQFAAEKTRFESEKNELLARTQQKGA